VPSEKPPSPRDSREPAGKIAHAAFAIAAATAGGVGGYYVGGPGGAAIAAGLPAATTVVMENRGPRKSSILGQDLDLSIDSMVTKVLRIPGEIPGPRASKHAPNINGLNDDQWGVVINLSAEFEDGDAVAAVTHIFASRPDDAVVKFIAREAIVAAKSAEVVIDSVETIDPVE